MPIDTEPVGPTGSQIDPLGRAMYDYQHGDPGRLVYRDGNTTQDGRLREFYFSPPAEWDDGTVDVLSRLADTGGPILDVGCGAGQHLLWLQENGVETVGVDVSPGAVATARMRGAADVIVADMHDLPVDGGFTGLHCIGTQLGLGGSLTGLTELLVEFDRVTTEDAVAVVDSYDPERIDDDLFGVRPDPRDGLAHRSFRVEYEPAIDDVDRIVGPTLQFLLCSPERLEDVTGSTAWTVVDVHREASDDAYYRAVLAGTTT